MDSTHMVQSTGGTGAAIRAALKPTNDLRRATSAAHIPSEKVAETPSSKPAGYGLPCTKCKTYYLANLNACPVCKSSERVSPVALAPENRPVVELQADAAVLDEERERFLREFKAKLYAAHMQINLRRNYAAPSLMNAAERTRDLPSARTVTTSCRLSLIIANQRCIWR